MTVGNNAEKIVGGYRRLSQLVCHEMLALGQVLIEHKKSLAISGNPDESMIVLYDMKSLMVDIIGGLLWKENQGDELVLSYQAQHARLVVYPLSAFVVSQHPAIGDKPFALTFRNLSRTHIDRERAAVGKKYPSVTHEQIAGGYLTVNIGYMGKSLQLALSKNIDIALLRNHQHLMMEGARTRHSHALGHAGQATFGIKENLVRSTKHHIVFVQTVYQGDLGRTYFCLGKPTCQERTTAIVYQHSSIFGSPKPEHSVTDQLPLSEMKLLYFLTVLLLLAVHHIQAS